MRLHGGGHTGTAGADHNDVGLFGGVGHAESGGHSGCNENLLHVSLHKFSGFNKESRLIYLTMTRRSDEQNRKAQRSAGSRFRVVDWGNYRSHNCLPP